MSRQDTVQPSEENLLELPEISAGWDHFSSAAVEAEKREDWTQAQVLWEYALINSVDGDEEPSYDNCGFGIVILSHLYHLMKSHHGFMPIDIYDRLDKKKYPPCGSWAAQLDKLQNCRNSTDVPDSNALAELFMAVLFGSVFFLFHYPFSDVLSYIILGMGLVTIAVLAYLIGSLTHSTLVGLIFLIALPWVTDNVAKDISVKYNLESSLMGTVYILRAAGLLVGFILLCKAVVLMVRDSKDKKRAAEAGRKYALYADRVYRHASDCCQAALKILQPGLTEDMAETAAINYKYAYESHDIWNFRRVKGDVSRDGWKDAIKMNDELKCMVNFYEDMKEIAEKHLDAV